MNFIKLGACLLLGLACSCNKEWLDVKPVQSMVIPTKISDLQALLDNLNVMNSDFLGMGEIAANDFQVADASFSRLTENERIAYLWSFNPAYTSNMLSEWNYAYARILRTNIVLDGLEKMKEESDTRQREELEGNARFHRAFNHYQLAQIFADSYVESASEKDLGLPFRSSSNVNLVVTRPFLKSFYEQILGDLTKAKDLLPPQVVSKTRPSKLAAYALLSRVYLAMSDFDNAMIYADSCLLAYNSLMDFNSDSDINLQLTNPIKQLNKETILLARIGNYTAFSPATLIVDSELYKLYAADDLRKKVFFREDATLIRYKGSYDGTRLLFCGLSTSEVLLNRAECFARKGIVDRALADLNALLKVRTHKNSFVPIATTDRDILLKEILLERRKELCFRGLRWTDLRRLNQDPKTEILLTREVAGSQYELLPRSARYTFAIPNQEVLLTGIEQND